MSERDNNLYTGSTTNLKRRFDEHNKGRVNSTIDRRPLKLIYYEVYPVKPFVILFDWGAKLKRKTQEDEKDF